MMRSCIDRSYVVIAVSLLLLAGVASSERLRGVCKEGCLDLPDLMGGRVKQRNRK